MIELAGRPERDSATIKEVQGRLATVLEDNERLRRALRLAQDEVLARKTEADGLRQRLVEVRLNLDRMTGGHRIDEQRLKELRNLAKMMATPPNQKS